MTPTMIPQNRTTDLTQVKNMKDLQAEIRLLKADLEMKENHLESNFKKLPQEGLKMAASKVLPAVISKKFLVGAYFVGKGIFRLNKTKNTLKSKVASKIRRTVILMAVNKFFEWKKNKKSTQLPTTLRQ